MGICLSVPSGVTVCLALLLQKKVDPTLPVAARPSGPMQRVLVKRLQRQRQLAQERLEDARRWTSELRWPWRPSASGQSSASGVSRPLMSPDL